ncbi:MAG: HAD family hydrolase [Pararhizobium sp.]
MTADALGGVLFDKDGTLIDFEGTWGPIILSATRHAAGGDPTLQRRLLVIGGVDPGTGRTAADSLFAAGNTAEIVAAFVAAGAPHDAAALARDLDAMFIDAAATAVPITATRALFDDLKARGLKLGIASSDNAASIARTVQALGVEDHVDFIAGYDSGHGAKPDAGMLLAFCAATGLQPGQVAMVGDNRHDMEMARAAGAGLRIAVLSGTGTRETLTPLADICLDSIADLPALLDGVG